MKNSTISSFICLFLAVYVITNASAQSCNNYNIETNTFYKGRVIGSIRIRRGDSNSCCNECNSRQNCVGWVSDDCKCYLYSRFDRRGGGRGKLILLFWFLLNKSQ